MIPKFRYFNKITREMCSADVFEFDFEGVLESVGDYLTTTLEIDQVELMQSTGLFDKNSVEIFEGDVVRVCDEANHKVKFIQGAFCIDFPKNGTPLLFYGENQLEVIGNRWENPELVEG